jgi:ribosomal protein S18 acetylase RimI-like enzyme
MNIRIATIADAPALAVLQQSVQQMHAAAFPERFRRNVPAETMERAIGDMLQAPATFWLVAEEVAEQVAEERQPIAYLNAEFREREETWCSVAQRVCYLAGVAVAPEYRRRGIARTLFAELQREADARGVTNIELDVWAFNDEARQVFASLGFRAIMQRMSLAR